MNNPSPPAPIPFRERLRRLLNRPLFGTVVIPRDARVDPADFPEEEFPIHCGKCGYPLKALPEPRCPECGTPFEPGRRIVEEYMLAATRRCSFARALRHALLGQVILWGAFIAITFSHAGVNRETLFGAFLAFVISGALMFAGALLIFVVRWSPSEEERKRAVRDYLIARARAAQRGQRNA